MQDRIEKIPDKEFVQFLSSIGSSGTFVQKLKIKYRPYVCPFGELLDYSKNSKSVYDIGCGSGQFCALVANYTKANKVKGIEIDESLVKNARKVNSIFKDKDVSFAKFSGNRLPQDIGDYDFIYMIDVYHHIPIEIRIDFMRQLYSNMKKGARLMLKDIDASSLLVPFNKIHDYVFAKEFGHEISNKHAEEILRLLGFNIIENRKKRVLVYPHYFILAQK